MKGLKSSATLFVLTVSSGLMMKSSSLLPFGLGLSLFVPAIFIYTYSQYSPVVAVFSSVLAALTVFFLGREVIFDVSSVLLLGPIFLIFKRFGSAASVVSGAFLLTFITLIEEKVYGFPPEVKKQLAGLASYRYAIYFFSSAVFSVFTYGICNWIVMDFPPLVRLRFGFWSVILFTFSALVVLFGSGTVRVISANLLILALSLLILQGIAVFIWFFQRLSMTWKLITGLLMFIFPLGFFLTALVLGVLDQKFNFRKLNGGKKNGSDPS